MKQNALDVPFVSPDLSQFYRSDPEKISQDLCNVSAKELLDQSERKALRLFHEAARSIPAYRDFLKKNDIDSASVRTISDFGKVPETSKENYINQYSLSERSWNGKSDAMLIASSSGTTGEPKLWPRGNAQELEAALLHELLFTEHYEINSKKTLAIMGFPLGTYVSGMATSLPLLLTANKHSNLTLLTAGNNKNEILRLLPKIESDFEQMILIGHPFFVKDLIETIKKDDPRWPRIPVKTFMCSEGFTEDWRKFLVKKLKKTLYSVMSVYGSSEMLLMGFETPFTIDARAFLANHRAERRSLFAENGLPDIFQYHPLMRYIELNADREFLFTANLGIPLIRYNMRDKGYLFSYDDFAAALPPSLYKRAWKLPIVALEGRSDYTVIFYAANIYPTHIRIALNHATFLNKITGKFAIEKKYTKNKDVSLMIHVELQPKIMTSYKLCSTLQKFIEVTLLELNSEYRASSYIVKHDIAPHVILHAYQSAPYFTPGIKPRYIV